MKKLLANKALLHEIIRFIIVGGIATLVDFLVASLFQYVIFPSTDVWLLLGFINVTAAIFVSTIMGFSFGVVVNYVLSILVVFKDVENKKTSRSISGFLIFLGLGIVGFIINLSIKELANAIIKFEGHFFWFAFIFALATLIVLIYNYITRKIFLFKPVQKNIDTTNE